MLTPPAAASQLIFDSVRIEARQTAAMAATATKIAVHTAWSETAFSPIDKLKMLDPATKV